MKDGVMQKRFSSRMLLMPASRNTHHYCWKMVWSIKKEERMLWTTDKVLEFLDLHGKLNNLVVKTYAIIVGWLEPGLEAETTRWIQIIFQLYLNSNFEWDKCYRASSKSENYLTCWILMELLTVQPVKVSQFTVRIRYFYDLQIFSSFNILVN